MRCRRGARNGDDAPLLNISKYLWSYCRNGFACRCGERSSTEPRKLLAALPLYLLVIERTVSRVPTVGRHSPLISCGSSNFSPWKTAHRIAEGGHNGRLLGRARLRLAWLLEPDHPDHWCNPPNCTPSPSGSLTWKLVLALPRYCKLRRFSSSSIPSFSASQFMTV
jgi:hypothetical protein